MDFHRDMDHSQKEFNMRGAWIGAIVLGLLPAVALAGRGEHRGGEHHDSVRFGFGIGLGVGYGQGWGYRGYSGPRDYCYSPRVYYRTSWYDPAPVYCPPPAVVYEWPVVVYEAPPAPEVIYSAPPVTYSRTTVQYVAPSTPYYYTETRYYYGR